MVVITHTHLAGADQPETSQPNEEASQLEPNLYQNSFL